VRAKDRGSTRTPQPRPLLLVDIDGVISLFARNSAPAGPGGGSPGARGAAGRPGAAPPAGEKTVEPVSGAGERPSTPGSQSVDGALHSIDGILHYLSSTAAAHLLSLERVFELVWASGWEEKADEHLPHLLGVPAGIPHLRFARASRAGSSLDAHWKLDAVDAYAGERPLAWIDDAFNPACHAWAAARPAPTLLVATAPERGLTDREAAQLEAWAATLARA
jgi:hypothetical protein